MDEVTVKITGLKELQANLEALPIKVGQKIFRKALKAAGKLVIDAMVRFAPKDTGFLSQHFNTKTKVIRNFIAGSIMIGPDGKADYPDRDGNYRTKMTRAGKIRKVGRISVASVARFLEFGTTREKKFPFMTQAFEATKAAAVEEIVKAIQEALAEVQK